MRGPHTDAPRRHALPLCAALLLALAPRMGQPTPAQAASLSFIVTSTTDAPDATPGDGVCADSSGQCTVRAAVEEADAQPSGSAITITIPAGNYLLPLGTLTLTRNTITLAGAASSTTTLDGQGQRVLVVAVTAFAQISGLTLRDGNAGSSAGGALVNLGRAVLRASALISDTASSGGGLYNGPAAQLAVLNSTVMSDTAPSGAGGGINNVGTLVVVGGTLTHNTAHLGGAIASTGTLTLTGSTLATDTAVPTQGYQDGSGGGLYTSGATTIISTTFSGDTAPLIGEGGGILNASPGILLVSHGTFSGNSARYGAAIYNAGGATLRMSGSSLTANDADEHGTPGSGGGIENLGALTVTTSTFSANFGGLGGAIDNAFGATLRMSGSSLTANIAASSGAGGGIFNYQGAIAVVTNSTLSDNSVQDYYSGGGGIYNYGTLTVTGDTFDGNGAVGEGGGIYNGDIFDGNKAFFGYAGGIDSGAVGTVTVSGSTFYGNAANSGGGIYNDLSGTATVTNSTLSGNTAPSGGGGGLFNRGTTTLSYVTLTANAGGGIGGDIDNNTSLGPATLVLTGTIIAASTASPNCAGPLTDGGYNLDDGATCGFTQTTSLTTTNPLLGPLQNNGGPTPTMALLPGSPAIDRGGTPAQGCPATDQRDQPRPDGGESQCDIGAYEAQGVG